MRRVEHVRGQQGAGFRRLLARGIRNSTVTLGAIFLALVVGEVFLRVAHPKYEYAAGAEFASDGQQIWKRKPNTRRQGLHPDTRRRHAIIHNSLGLRQHREFSAQMLEDRVNIGFFGDSFTENLRIPAQYMFTEVLDFLLNYDAARFNVLNFGVDGYGTGQSYLRYLDAKADVRLDTVIYVFCANDLGDLRKNALFRLDEHGRLAQRQVEQPSLAVTVLSQLHLTYLLIDVEQRLRLSAGRSRDGASVGAPDRLPVYQEDARGEQRDGERAERIAGDIRDERANDESIATSSVFLALVDAWQSRVRADGGRFYLLLLPRAEEAAFSDSLPESLPVIDLFARFRQSIPDYRYSDWRFENDGHWSEAGNMQAARHLYRILEPMTGRGPIPERELERRLRTYYAAYPDGRRFTGRVEGSDVADTRLDKIRGRYLPLESVRQ